VSFVEGHEAALCRRPVLP